MEPSPGQSYSCSGRKGAGFRRDKPAAALSLAQTLAHPCCLIGTGSLLTRASYQQGKQTVSDIHCSDQLSPEKRKKKRLAGAIQRTPDPLTKEMESWCLFNENNKAQELNAPWAPFWKGSLARTDGGLHLKRLSRAIISDVNFWKIIFSMSHLCIIFFHLARTVIFTTPLQDFCPIILPDASMWIPFHFSNVPLQ